MPARPIPDALAFRRSACGIYRPGPHFMTGRGWLQTTKLKRSRRLAQSIERSLSARYAVIVPHRRTPAAPEAGLQIQRRRPPHRPSPKNPKVFSGIRSRLPQVITPAAPDRPTNQYASGRHPSGDAAKVILDCTPRLSSGNGL